MTVPLVTVTVNDTGAVVVSRAVGRAAGLAVGGLVTTGNVGICIAVTHGAQPSAPPLVLPVKLVERASTAHRRRSSSPVST